MWWENDIVGWITKLTWETASSTVNERDELHHLVSTVTFSKSTQTDNYCEDYHPFVIWHKGAISENAGTSENDNQHSRRFEECHFHVNSNAVIVGNQSKIIVRKDKRKKSIGSLNTEVKQQNMNTTGESSSSSNQSDNRKSNQIEPRQIDLESSTSDSENINSDDSEEETSLKINAIVNLKLCKTAAEIEKIIFEYEEDLKKLTAARTKSLKKHFLGLLNTASISDHSKMKKLQRLDSLTRKEKSSNMYTVI